MASRIDTVSARDKLRLRRGPYWHRVSKGSYLGFRRMTKDGYGTWLARWLDESSGKQVYKTLGELTELPAHLRFDAAQREALAWFDHLGRGGAIGKPTVRDACTRYLQHVQTHRTARAANDIRARFDNYVLNDAKLAGMELAKLTPAQLDAWRKALREMPTRSGARRGEQRSDSTLNRDMTCLRAALNLAMADGLVTSDFAWRGKLRPIKNADQRRPSCTLIVRNAGCSQNMRQSTWRRFFVDCPCCHYALAPWPRCAQATLMRVWKCSRSGRTNPAATAGSNYQKRLRVSLAKRPRTSCLMLPCSLALAEGLGTRTLGSGRSRRLSKPPTCRRRLRPIHCGTA